MKNILSLLCVLMYSTHLIHSQNLVPNGSFEELKAAYPNSPTDLAQLQHLKEWRNFNTSDLRSEEVGKINGLYAPASYILPAHTGTKYIGFGPCEGAQVKLTESIKKKQWVRVSFWFSPRDFYDSEVNVYLLENEASSNALDDCYNPNIDFEAHFTLDVKANNSLGNAEHIPGEWYFYQSKPQLVVDAEYAWLALKGINLEGAAGDERYLFVDDVTVESFDYCEHLCAGGGEIQLVVPPGDGAVGNNGAENFFFTVKNATELEVTIWNWWGEETFYWHSYDVNGLIDPGYNDFAFVWNGHSTATGGDVMVPQVYNYRITARSCASALPYQKEASVTLAGIVDPPAVIYDETINRVADNCCIEHKYYQNHTFSGYNRTDVNDFITAGSNVTGGTQGPVIVNSGADVRFHAGNTINLLPNEFIVNSGGLFSATIEPCASSPKSKSLGTRNLQRDYYEEIRKDHSGNLESHPIFISPNPSHGTFVVRGLTPDYHDSFIIYDMLGTKIYTSLVHSSLQNVELPKIQEGIYILTVFSGDGGIQSTKLMISE